MDNVQGQESFKRDGVLEGLGPDGYQPGFFKRTWETTGQTIFNFTQTLLKGGEVANKDAEALLALVPKETKPNLLRSFRPISICNVRMKLVSKMIANRLKVLLRG